MLLTDVNRDSSGADEKEDVMKVVVAIDSLKGSLTSLEAGEAIRDGVLNVFPDADVQVRPLADGGEGTVEALVLGMGGELQKIMVTGPHGRQVEAAYGILSDKTTAVMEMAKAAGITPQMSFRSPKTWGELTGAAEPIAYQLDGTDVVYMFDAVALDEVKTRGLVLAGVGFTLTKIELISAQ